MQLKNCSLTPPPTTPMGADTIEKAEICLPLLETSRQNAPALTKLSVSPSLNRVGETFPFNWMLLIEPGEHAGPPGLHP